MRAVETALRSIDSGAQYRAEPWDGANPESEEGASYRPIYHTKGATSAPPETCTRSRQTTRRSSTPPTKRNTGRLASKPVASGTRKTSTRRETQTPAGARFPTHGIK